MFLHSNKKKADSDASSANSSSAESEGEKKKKKKKKKKDKKQKQEEGSGACATEEPAYGYPAVGDYEQESLRPSPCEVCNNIGWIVSSCDSCGRQMCPRCLTYPQPGTTGCRDCVARGDFNNPDGQRSPLNQKGSL